MLTVTVVTGLSAGLSLMTGFFGGRGGHSVDCDSGHWA